MARGRKLQGIPDDYAEMIGELAEDPAYQAAWAHAEGMGNPPKACMIYAENHWQEYQEEQAPTPESVQEEIDRLLKQKEQLEANGS